MKHISLLAMSPDQIAAVRARIPKRLDGNGCRTYTDGPKPNPQGYVRIGLWDHATRTARLVMAHRAVYYVETGVDPGRYTVEHLCRNRLCLRIEHMTLLSPRANTMAPTSRSMGRLNADKTQCHLGHPFDEANTAYHLDKKGRTSRRCRICQRLRNAARVKAAQAARPPKPPKPRPVQRVKGIAHRIRQQCIHGHEFSKANTRYDRRKDGSVHRACRACGRARHQAKVAAQQQASEVTS